MEEREDLIETNKTVLLPTKVELVNKGQEVPGLEVDLLLDRMKTNLIKVKILSRKAGEE